jgi:WD40 repeat protein
VVRWGRARHGPAESDVGADSEAVIGGESASAVAVPAADMPASDAADPAFALDAFVSYSRADADYAHELVDAASRLGRVLWIDRDGIPPGAPWREELGSAIEAALAFVCVLSPLWLRSTECRLEYTKALSLGKRIIPVLLADCDPPEEISDLNWIDARYATPDEVIAALLRAVDTDHERVKAHTTWLSRALRWESSGEDRSHLLRGSELLQAEAWLSRAGAQPSATPLQRRFIETSRADERLRRRRRVVAVTTAGVLVLVLAIFGIIELEAKSASRRQSQSRALASASLSQIGTDPELSLLLARAAWRISPTPQALNALEASVVASRVRFAVTGLPRGGNGVAWAAGDGIVIAAGGNGQIGAWEASDDRSHGRITAGAGSVIGFAADQAGTLGVAVTADGQAVLWRLAPPSETLERVAQLASGRAVEAAISANGAVAAVRDVYGNVTIWRLPSMSTRILSFTGQKGYGCVALTATGDEALIGGGAGAAVLWHPNGSTTLVARYATPVVGCSFDATGSDILTYSEDGSGIVQRASDGHVALRVAHVFEAALGPGARYLATTDINGDVQLYDVTRRTVRALQQNGAVESTVAFSNDGKTLAVGGSDGVARVWAMSGGAVAVLRGATKNVSGLAFSPDGAFLLAGDGSGTVLAWALPAGPLSLTVQPEGSSTARMNSVALSRDGSVAVTTGEFVWSSSTSTGTTACPAGADCAGPLTHTEQLATNAVLQEGLPTDAAISPDGADLAVSSETGRVGIWRATNASEVVGVAAIGQRIDQLAFSPDGRLLAVSGRQGEARLIDAATGRLVAPLRRDGSDVYVVAFASDDRIITAGSSGAIWVWDGRGHFLRKLAELPAAVLALAADPRGDAVAAASGNQIVVLRLSDGHVLQTFNTNAGDVTALAYAGRTGLIVAGSVNRQVAVWDPRTGESAESFTLPSGVAGIAIDQARQLIAVATVGTGAYVLHCDVCVTPSTLVAIAARDSTRALTPRERAEWGVPSGVLTGGFAAPCVGTCETTSSAPTTGTATQSPGTTTSITNAVASDDATFISRADAICLHTNATITPVQSRLYADEARDSASLQSDTPANRRRLSADFLAAAAIFNSHLEAVRALPLPSTNRAGAERYVDDLASQIPLMRLLAQTLNSPAQPGVSPQYEHLTAEIAAVQFRLEGAQNATIAAAKSFGFHVCGTGK